MDVFPADRWLYVAQLCYGVAFALVCEFVIRRENYEPDLTWAVATAGVAGTGILICLRLMAAPLPQLFGEPAYWWLFWVWVFSFFSAGVPIIIWQLIVQRQRLAQRSALLFPLEDDDGQPTG